MTTIFSMYEGPLAIFGLNSGETFVLPPENTLEAKRQANRAWAAAEATGALVEGLEGATNLIETALQPGAPASSLTETPTAKILTAAERERVQAQAAFKRAGAAIARSITFTGRRNRIVGGFSQDGSALDFAGNLIERVSGAMRLRSMRATRGIDLLDDGAISYAGQKARATTDPTIVRATVGSRRRFIERLSTNSYRVFGLAARSNGEVQFGGLLSRADGRITVGGEKRRAATDSTTVRQTLSPRRRPIEILNTAGYRVFKLFAGADGSVRLPGLYANPAGQVMIGAGITSNTDGSVVIGGERRRSTAATFFRAVVGRRSRVIERLSASDYSVHGFRVARSGGNLDIYLDGQRAIRVANGGAPQFTGLNATGGRVSDGDTYLRTGEGLMPVLTNMRKWAIWGSSSANYLEDNMAALAASRGGAFYPGGQGGERIEHHAARLGSHPALLTFPSDSIPASGSIDLPRPASWATSASLLSYAGIVGGVAGVLSAGPTTGLVTFTRTTAGDAVAVRPDAPFLPTDGLANRGSFNILNMGKNSISAGQDPALTVQITREAYQWLSPLVNRSLVVNHFANSDWQVAGAAYARLRAVNAGLAAFFGSHLVDLHGFVCLGQPKFGKTVWEVAGITPTADDLSLQVQGLKPWGLSRDEGHLSEAADGAVMWLIDQTTIALGYQQ